MDSAHNSAEETYWRLLLNEDPVSLYGRTLATFDASEGTYLLKVLDLNYKIDPRHRIIERDDGTAEGVDWDTRLLALAYLTGATGASLVGRWVSPIGFSGGNLFFSSDAHNLEFSELLLAFKSPGDFLRAGQQIGEKKDVTGDASFVLWTLPRIPILFIYWTGDTELPSRISVLVDESARNHLAIDGLWLAIRVSEKRLLQVGGIHR